MIFDYVVETPVCVFFFFFFRCIFYTFLSNMALQQLETTRDQLRNEMNAASPNFQKIGQLLIQAKVISQNTWNARKNKMVIF